MFSKELGSLTLTSDVAERVFGRIKGDRYGNDVSFVATLRALLIPRTHIAEIKLKYSRVDWRTRDLNNNSIYDIIRYGVSRHLAPNGFYITNVNSTEGQNGNDSIFDRFDRDFINHDERFKRMEDLEAFAAKRLRARFYIDESNRRILILAENLNTRSWHFLQSMIPRYFPWFFEDKPLNDIEKQLLASCLSKYAVDYERLIEEIAQAFDMRKHQITSVLGDFEKRAHEYRLNETQRYIQDFRSQISDANLHYSNLIARLSELLAQETGIQQQINSLSEENELVEFFTSNKNIIPLTSEGTCFDFIVTGCFENFDPEMFSSFIKNRRSHLFRDYQRSDAFKNDNDVELFLSAIFSDEPILRVKVCAYYYLDTRGVVSTRSHFSFPDEYISFIPNPHLQLHSCLGNHKRYIEEALRAGNTIGAITQCISSAKSINLGEGVTVRPFLSSLLSSTHNKYIILPDNSEVTPTEALAWLKEQNEKEKQEEQKEE